MEPVSKRASTAELTDPRHVPLRIRLGDTDKVRTGLADERTVRHDRHILSLAGYSITRAPSCPRSDESSLMDRQTPASQSGRPKVAAVTFRQPEAGPRADTENRCRTKAPPARRRRSGPAAHRPSSWADTCAMARGPLPTLRCRRAPRRRALAGPARPRAGRARTGAPPNATRSATSPTTAECAASRGFHVLVVDDAAAGGHPQHIAGSQQAFVTVARLALDGEGHDFEIRHVDAGRRHAVPVEDRRDRPRA